MPAASTDFFTEVGNPGSATSLTAPGHTVAGTTFNVISTSNWPTTTGVIFAVDQYDISTRLRVPGTYTEWEGTVTSSTSITGAVIRYGTDQNYSAGTTTRVYIPVASSRENRLAQGLQVSFDQDGTLKAGAVDNSAALASNVVTTAKILDANVTNAKLATGAGQPGGAYVTYTPTITNFTLGNGTITTARYTQVGQTVKVSILVTLGSTSVMGTSPTISLPVTASSTYVIDRHNFGVSNLTDSGTADIMGIIGFKSTTTVTLYAAQANSTYVQRINIDSSTPFVWTTSDRFSLEFEYEAA